MRGEVCDETSAALMGLQIEREKNPRYAIAHNEGIPDK